MKYSTAQQSNSFMKRALRRIAAKWLFDFSTEEWTCSRPSFSQFGEDRIIAELLQPLETGFYVDVGAYDPMLLSNTYGLYSASWRGIVIDANPNCVRRLREKRPRDTVVHAAVGEEEKDVDFVCFAAGNYSTLAEYQTDVPDDVRSTATTVTVRQLALRSILHDNEVRSVDFMNVDCEGADLQVLKSNDWNRWRPAVIAVEDHAEDFSRSETASFLLEKGYNLVSRAVLTSIFRRSE